MLIPKFETDRLILRAITIEDAPAYAKHFVDYEVIRQLARGVPWPYPEDGVRKFILSFILPKQGHDQWHWGIFLKDQPDEMIGGVELWREPRPDNRGFWLGRKFWGQGLMTEAVTPITDFAFSSLGFEKLIFSNAVGNTASHKIKKKMGARLLRVQPGEFVDRTYTEIALWEITKTEWQEFRLRPGSA